MKTIILKNLTISNFRGVQSLDINFTNETNIFGRNKSGKSTIYNAYLWLMFGRDDQDRANHELFDNTKEATHDNALLCSVKGILEIDGYDYVLERTAKQKWSRNRVSGEYERTGSDDYYYEVDGVPKSAGEYKAFIASLIIDEKVFKCITQTRYFTSLHWKEQREILMQIVGDIKSEELTGDYAELMAELRNMSKDELLAKIDGKRKPIKSRLKEIPAIIDDHTQKMPERVSEVVINSKILEHKAKIEQIEQQLAGSSTEIESLIKQRNNDLQVIADKEFALTKAQMEYDGNNGHELHDIQCAIDNIDAENKNIEYKNAEAKRKYDHNISIIQNLKYQISNNNKRREIKLAEYDTLNAKVFDMDKACPTCGQALPTEEIEKLQSDFNKKKTADLTAIRDSGVALKNEREVLEKQLSELEAEIEKGYEVLPLFDKSELEKELAERKANIVPFEKTERYEKLALEIQKLRECITIVPIIENSALIENKKQHYADITLLEKELNVNSEIERTEKHIQELKEEQMLLGIELTKLDGMEFTLKAYERECASIMQHKVNNLFRYCKVAIIEIAKDGSNRDICEITDLNGVKISVINNADQQLIGLDIINVLSNHYGIKSPCFMDNAESISTPDKSIPTQDCQIIKLYVSDDEKLRMVMS